MKQLPHVASALYGFPWSILPASHAELGMLYRSYVRGELHAPVDLAPGGKVTGGISYVADHTHGIAILTLEGIVSKRAPDMMCGPQLIDLSRLDALLDEVAADAAIETVVMDWNTPGGMVIGLQETAEKIRELSTEYDKRIVAYTDLQCCSAGYYLAAAADEFYAAPSSAIGSIGTYCAGLDDSRAWEMEGMELIMARSGSLKAMGHPGKAWEANEREWLQTMADNVGGEFREWVNSRRDGIDEGSMQGQWFFAKDDPGGLVDGLYNDLPALLAHLMAGI